MSIPQMQQKAQTLNCTALGNMTMDCYKSILLMINHANNEVWTQYKKENKLGADMYTVVILGLFASVLICLLYRSMKRSDSVDDQVMLLLSSMQIHVDYEERERQRKKMKEEKDKTQSFIASVAMKGFRRFARSRSASQVKERPSVCSVPASRPFSPFQNIPHRARSYQGYLPEIVVTDHQLTHNSPRITVTHSQPMIPLTRHSSSGSYQSQYRDNGSDTGSVFLYPDGIYEYSDSSQ